MTLSTELATERLIALRKQMQKEGVEGFLLPVNDPFMGEYLPECYRRLPWLTGFTGSAGMVAVLPEKAALFVDGRYTIQAEMEVEASLYDIHNSGDLRPEQWLAQEIETPGFIVGYDPWLHTENSIRQIRKVLEKQEIHLAPMEHNPVDRIWEERPGAPDGSIEAHPLEFSGKAAGEKLADLQQQLTDNGMDALMLTDAASVCWLLNIRGSDVPHVPLVLSYALVTRGGKVRVYTEPREIDEAMQRWLGEAVTVVPLSEIREDLRGQVKHQTVQCDPAEAPSWFFLTLKNCGAEVVEKTNPCLLPKACKNETELEGMRRAHVRDGVALTRFLRWLDQEVASGSVTELSAVARLEQFRKEQEHFSEPSFDTISGFGPDGAIVHYRVSEETDRKIEGNGLYLVDSGGQYLDGTTDVTRTVAIGEPTEEQKEAFTRVLKGHIALARARFPKGTTGVQLDALARYHLWQEQMDYDHGTGHGVGSYLSVHEGPQRISKRGGDVALQPGMILSNEPGYYRAGEYGIRIENLVVVRECDGRPGWMEFETLTKAPIDMRLVVEEMLTTEEQEWLQAYQSGISEAV